MAQAYDGGGKSDWFLLSENELDILSTYVRNSSLSSSYAFDNELIGVRHKKKTLKAVPRLQEKSILVRIT
jgi:hypothetical protein